MRIRARDCEWSGSPLRTWSTEDVISLGELAGMSSCLRGATAAARWESAVGGASRGPFMEGFLPTSLFKGSLKREEGTAGMVVCSARAAGGVIPARPKWLQSLLKIRVDFSSRWQVRR